MINPIWPWKITLIWIAIMTFGFPMKMWDGLNHKAFVVSFSSIFWSWHRCFGWCFRPYDPCTSRRMMNPALLGQSIMNFLSRRSICISDIWFFAKFIDYDFDFMISIISVFYSNSLLNGRAMRSLPGPVWLVRSGVLFRRTGNPGTWAGPKVFTDGQQKPKTTFPYDKIQM